MNNINYIKELLLQTETRYLGDGTLDITPIVSAETIYGGPLTGTGRPFSTRGHLTVQPDGKAHFHPWATCRAPRYRVKATTQHGKLKTNGRSTVAVFTFPNDMTPLDMATGLAIEARKMVNYMIGE